jgi:hypothetical protein
MDDGSLFLLLLSERCMAMALEKSRSWKGGWEQEGMGMLWMG